ncbi:MAG: polyribonucleotide nucleotidyltransferase, partial [Myxococcales bacterium]|nr:polyribonucleotide nucleotidyltransferase [Myxococcales bacterium]
SKETKDLPFLPLTVEYREPNYGAGKIPGGYFKREGRPTNKEIVGARCIDRPIRPLFPKGYRYDTQIISNAVSNDRENEPDVLAMTAASAALTLSEIPWEGPIAGVRVGRLNGRFVAFPTFSQQEECDIVLVVAVSRDAIVMVEGGAAEADEDSMIDALMFAKEVAQPLIDLQDRLREKVGQAKREYVPPQSDAALEAAVFDHARDAFTKALAIRGKHERHDALKEAGRATRAALAERFPDRDEELKAALGKLEKKLVRTTVINDRVRIDGRGTRDIRPIYIEAGLLERPHGSALFQRGETQALVTTTLGTESDVQRLDTIRGDVYIRFMLHYNFPPFCTGEVKPIRGQSRREIGHGTLAERALSYVMPDVDQFPYMVRIVSETL